MARLMRKTVRGHEYWYAVESKRVNGKPRIVWQRYLGKMEDIIARCLQGPGAYDVVVYDFGAIAAVLSIAERLGLESIVDRHVPKGQQEVGVGRYLLLAAINRVVAAKSKAQIGAWYEHTVLRRLWGLPAHHFTSQRFWLAMDRVDAAAIEAIELDLVRSAIAEFGVQVRGLIYDATNFFTYINTRTMATLPQRGHNKQKRNDLRQVNLALLTTADGHVPLLHETYPGHVGPAARPLPPDSALQHPGLTTGGPWRADSGSNGGDIRNAEWAQDQAVPWRGARRNSRRPPRGSRSPHTNGRKIYTVRAAPTRGAGTHRGE